MIQSRMHGDVRITRVLEYSGPTHLPDFLFPDRDHSPIMANAAWLAPNHYVPAMNRLIVTIQIWVVHAGGNVILIDTGVGNHKPRPAERMNMLNSLVLPWLEAAGAGPDQVTHVVMTHLHTDHVGWNTVLADGRWVPTFPKARYLIPKGDFDPLKAQHEKTPNAVFADSILPVVEAGLADMIDETREVAGCLVAEPAPGHSPGQLAFRLRSGGEEAIFSADVMHSPIQIARPDWNTRYCVMPDVARATRGAFLARAADREALIMPMHFGEPYCGYIRRQGEGYAFEGAAW
jgi:glyoxylase-like metal-dependent hydrolase (beta-lactamase superfamily II)